MGSEKDLEPARSVVALRCRARVQCLCLEQIRMPFGPDDQVENKTKESTGKYAELKRTCTLEDNADGKCLASPQGRGGYRVRIGPHESDESIGSITWLSRAALCKLL